MERKEDQWGQKNVYLVLPMQFEMRLYTNTNLNIRGYVISLHPSK